MKGDRTHLFNISPPGHRACPLTGGGEQLKTNKIKSKNDMSRRKEKPKIKLIKSVSLETADELNHCLMDYLFSRPAKLSFLQALKSRLSYLHSLPKKLALICLLYRAL